MKLSIFTICLMFVASVAFAEEKGWSVLETKDNTFKNAKLVKIDPDGIRIVHDGGAAKIPYERLNDAEREQFHFDPVKAAEFRNEKRQDRRADYERRLAEFNRKEAEAKNAHVPSGLQFRYMMVKVAAVLPNGVLFCYPYESGAPAGGVVQGFNALRRPIDRVTHTDEYTNYDKPMIVTNVQGSWAEGDVLQGLAARAGVKQHEGRSIAWFVSK